jgi:hypothetical protein
MIAILARETGISASNPHDPNGKSLDPRPDNQSATATEFAPALATNPAEKTMSSSGMDEHRLISPETWARYPSAPRGFIFESAWKSGK